MTVGLAGFCVMEICIILQLSTHQGNRWESGASPPGAALVTEGRVVAAGALADQGRLAEAVQLLERGWKVPSRPRDHHLRRAYALADLYERSGATPRARKLFTWINRSSHDFTDVAERLRALS
mgnify:CR=1 FL=1